MKTLNEQVTDIMSAKTTKINKENQLKELGLTPVDIFCLFQAEKYKKTINELMGYTVGVEIECFNVDRYLLISMLSARGVICQEEGYNHETRQYFKIVNDCSIDGCRTAEIVSPILQDLQDLKKVCDTLNDLQARVNKSCGLHIHVGLDKISFGTYKNIFLNYQKIEKIIDTFMPYSRRGSIRYAKSTRDVNLADCHNTAAIAYRFEQDRYYKINPISYKRHNTIEFRHHSGTTNFEKIKNWVMFILALIEFSKNQVLENATDINDLVFLNDDLKSFYKNRANDFEIRY